MAGRAGAILPIALGVVLARWGGAVGAPQPSASADQSHGAAQRSPSPSTGGVEATFGGGGGCGLCASKYH